MCLRKTGALVVSLLLLGGDSALAFTHGWSHSYGGTNAEYPFRVSCNSAGVVAVAGYFFGTADFGGGPMTSLGSSDAFVACYDTGGHHLWSKRLGDTGGDVALGVAVDETGAVVVTGYFEGSVDFGGGALVSNGSIDLFLVKYSPLGGHLWSRSVGSSATESGVDVAVDASGGILLTGYVGGTVDFGGGDLTGPGGADTFLAKFDSGGGHVWSALHGGTDTDTGWNVAFSGGGLVLAGYFKGTADVGGGPMISTGDNDIYVAGYDANGGHLWSHSFGSVQDDQPAGIGVDANGRVTLTGYFHDTVDFGGGGLTSTDDDDVFLVQYDASGNHEWSQAFGGIAKDKIYGLVVDGSDNVVITGGFPNSIDFGGDVLTREGSYDEIYVAKFDASGSHVWSGKYGSSLDDAGRGIAVDGYDNVVITGIHEGDIDFGGGLLANRGFYDVFVAKLAWPNATSVTEHGGRAPAQCALRQNTPNPFNPSTTIHYTVPASGGYATLSVYDVSGRHVRTLISALQTPGEKRVVWDGRDGRGHEVSSGVYFYRLTAPGVEASRRMVVVR